MEELTDDQVALARAWKLGWAHRWTLDRVLAYAAAYAAGMAKGRLEEAKWILIRVGEHRFGPIGPPDRLVIEAMTDLQEVRSLLDLVFADSAWSELMTSVRGTTPAATSGGLG